MIRPLTENERQALRMLVQGLNPDERSRLLADIETSSVEEVTDDASRLLFHLAGYQRPKYRGQHAYAVEGVVTDDDGREVTIALYADENDRLFELEFIKWGDRPLIKPNWNTLRLQP